MGFETFEKAPKPLWEEDGTAAFEMWFDDQDTRPEEEQSPEFKGFLKGVAEGSIVSPLDLDALRARRKLRTVREK